MEKENLFKPKVDYKERYHQESLFKNWRKNEVLSLLLDNSLITATNQKRVDIKLIDCGDYKQVYYSKKPHLKKDKNLDKMKDLHKICYEVGEKGSGNIELDIITSYYWSIKFKFSTSLFLSCLKFIDYYRLLLLKIKNSKSSYLKLKQVELKNINRSKFEMQRLVKMNIDKFKSFITLTFADNITDIKTANKKFATWRTKVNSIYKDFAYVCVPEFQRRGAIHYHLLTNLDLEQSPLVIIPQKGKKHQYDVKYWSYGFTSVYDMKDINVVGYISKYMTKDIDNRLWGHRRYLYSQNLKRPEIIELNLSNPLHFKMYLEIVNEDYKLTYEKEYTDFLNNDIIYEEYQKLVS